MIRPNSLGHIPWARQNRIQSIICYKFLIKECFTSPCQRLGFDFFILLQKSFEKVPVLNLQESGSKMDESLTQPSWVIRSLGNWNARGIMKFYLELNTGWTGQFTMNIYPSNYSWKRILFTQIYIQTIIIGSCYFLAIYLNIRGVKSGFCAMTKSHLTLLGFELCAVKTISTNNLGTGC